MSCAGQARGSFCLPLLTTSCTWVANHGSSNYNFKIYTTECDLICNNISKEHYECDLTCRYRKKNGYYTKKAVHRVAVK